jgi:hypothetical protein
MSRDRCPLSQEFDDGKGE